MNRPEIATHLSKIFLAFTLASYLPSTIGSSQEFEADGAFHQWHAGKLQPSDQEKVVQSEPNDLGADVTPLTESTDTNQLNDGSQPIVTATEDELSTEIESVDQFVVDFNLPLASYRYRNFADSTTYLPGNGDDFGWISFEWGSGLEPGKSIGLVSHYGFHLLSGPNRAEIPPRVYDVVWGIQMRDQIGPLFAYDLSANFGIFADFKDSVRQGIQFPGHAVGILRPFSNFQVVFGVDYLGQDDIKILPVGGIRFQLLKLDAELVFPRPRISLSLDSTHRLFVAGRIGGGTWDIERSDESNDVFTYRDHRVMIGTESLDLEDGSRGTFELGFSFNRSLSFRNDPITMDLDQAFLIRWTSYH